MNPPRAIRLSFAADRTVSIRLVIPELVVSYHRAQEYVFERPQYGSIWSECQARRPARDDVVQGVGHGPHLTCI